MNNRDNAALLNEKDSMERQILGVAAYTEEEKNFVQAHRLFTTLRALLRCTLTREEYRYYTQELRTEEMDPSALVAYVRSYYQTWTPPLDVSKVVEIAEAFYAAVYDRDTALTNNIQRALEENKTSVAILVLGGFHTDGITAQLAQRGLSFIIITPTIDATDAPAAPDTYYKVMTRFWQEERSTP
jgi:glycerol dehydrogenase-like iron-containing ADH family enzyme